MNNRQNDFIKTDTLLKWFSYSLVLGSILLFWALIVSCLVYFPRQTVSTNLQDLSWYGDFFGGIVGTIVSIASLGITIYLARLLHRIEQENVRKSIFTPIKYQELTQFKTECDNGFYILANFKEENTDLMSGYVLIQKSVSRLILLFPELNNGTMGFEINDILKPLYWLVLKGTMLNAFRGPEYQAIPTETLEENTIRDMEKYYYEGWNSYSILNKHLSKWALEKSTPT